MIDTEQFRRKVAGLIDPNRHPTGAGDAAAIREEANQLCLVLCELFGSSLDRMTLWDRIGSALSSAAAKCDDGDTDRFASLCLDHVKADHAAAARHEGFSAWILTLTARSEAHRQAFVRHCGAKTPIVLVHARNAWEMRKQMNTRTKDGAS